MSSRRPFVVFAVALLALVGTVLADRRDSRPRPTALAAAEPASGSRMARAEAVSAAWYCPGGPLAAIGQAEVSVSLANITARPLPVRLTALPVAGTGDPVERAVTVPALGTTTVALADVLGGPRPAGASIVGPGGLVVQQSIKTPEGAAVGPCASGASDRWFTAAGSTAFGFTLFIPVLNPFPDDAIIEMAFSTDQGRAVPGDLQGLLVPARSLRVVDVSDYVRRRDAVSAEVVARRGRIVVGRNLRKGVGSSLTLAAPAPATTWYIPGGVRADGVTNRLVVANPSDQDTEVSVEIHLAEGAIEPFTLAVSAQDRAELSLDDPRVPKSVPYSIIARARDDVPIVAERTTEGKPGRSDVLGSPMPDRAWVTVLGGPRGQDSLALYNAGDGQAEVTLTPLDGDGGLLPGGPLRITPGGRATFRLDDKANATGGGLLIESTQPIVVERDSGDGAPTQGGLVAVAVGRT